MTCIYECIYRSLFILYMSTCGHKVKFSSHHIAPIRDPLHPRHHRRGVSSDRMRHRGAGFWRKRLAICLCKTKATASTPPSPSREKGCNRDQERQKYDTFLQLSQRKKLWAVLFFLSFFQKKNDLGS
jgi:hypothetical protein